MASPGPAYAALYRAADEITAALADRAPEAAGLFRQCFLNTLETTVRRLPDGTTFVATGDIPAMWLRDSAAQVEPYVRYAGADDDVREMIRGVIHRQAAYIRLDPYANAFNESPSGRGHTEDIPKPGPWVWERKWELDSLCYPVRLCRRYLDATGDTTAFDENVHEMLRLIVATMRTEQHHDGSPYRFTRPDPFLPTDTLPNDGRGTPSAPTGMVWSGFRPSDDACTYGYLVPANMFAVVALGHIADLAAEIYGDAELAAEAAALRDEIDAGIQKHAIVEHPEHGPIYAYEVDGLGNHVLMDDANIPSLLSIPYLGYRPADAMHDPNAPATEDRHALVVVVDYNLRGMARDAWVSSHVDKLIEQARAEAEGNPMLRFEPLEPQQARALLEAAMKATRESGGRGRPRPVSESYSAYHAFARARIKALPPGRKRPAPLYSEAPYNRERRAMLAAEFLASDAAEQLSDPSAASRCADHIIDYGCDQDFGRPLRVSPTKCETFLLDWLPRKVLLSPAEQEAMPHVLAAWVRFAAPRMGLPEQGVMATLDAVWEATAKFTEAYRDPTTFGLDRTLVKRLLPDGDLSALARRAFAFPYLEGVRDNIILDTLNPTDEADRRILIELDHVGERGRPDLAEHLAWHEEIAKRLWDGDPPELWDAAQRLLDLGHDRHDVLHVLIEIAERIGNHPDELRDALNDIADLPDSL